MARPTVLVTGGTQGIGRAVCDALADDHHLLVGGRDQERVEAVCSELPSAAPFVADLTDPDDTYAAVTALAGTLPSEGGVGLHGLVHSAGVLGHGRSVGLDRQAWRDVLELNLVAVADLTRVLLPMLRAARGTVVLVNSGSGLKASPGTALYSASKFGMRAYADALREEERPHGVRVSSVHPGRVATPMQEELRRQEGGDYVEADYVRPESVAAVVRMALTIGDDAALESVSVRPR